MYTLKNIILNKYRFNILIIITFLNTILLINETKGCPQYGVYYKGTFCLAANGLVWWKANSWFECRERCKSNLYSLIPCKMFAWDSNGGMCTLQNGDTNCKQNVSTIISGKPDSSVTGSCATTCTVGSWSSWSNTCIPKVYGGLTYRKRSIAKKPTYPLEKCPHLQEVVNCSEKNWGSMSNSVLNDENSALNYVLSGVILQDALGKNISTTNCPNYDVGVLGWGCNLNDDLNYGNIYITTSYTWQDCLNRCKQRSDCKYFNFRATGSGTSPCYLILGDIGCSFHALNWISGSRELAVRYGECDINCVLGDWTNWSGCNSALCIDGKAFNKRSRPIITSPRGSGSRCGSTREVKECTESYSCLSNQCIVGSWSSWSSCNETCTGERIRRRTVQQIPSPGGIPCPNLFEIIKTNECDQIIQNNKDCSNSSSSWSSWSSCSATCGGGIRTRYKQSSNKINNVETCNTEPCKIYKIQENKQNFTPDTLFRQFSRICLVTGYYNVQDRLKVLSEYNLNV